MNKLTTVYIPTKEELEDYHFHDKSSEAFVFTPKEFKQLLSDAFDAGTKSVILQITNKDDNTIGYLKELTTKKIGEVVKPHIRIRDKKEYIENFLNK